MKSNDIPRLTLLTDDAATVMEWPYPDAKELLQVK